MGYPRTRAERDYDNEVWRRLGPIAAALLAGLFFPALPIGLFIGIAVGLLWPRARQSVRGALKERRGTGWSLLVAGAVVALIYAVFAVAGPLAIEIDRFLSSWHPPGPKVINWKAALRFPWGWLPIASAIALATAGVTIVLRNRR
jgi:cation transport ATPase